jgi:hypothetical protein
MAVSGSIGVHLSYPVAADDKGKQKTHGRHTENDHGGNPDGKIHDSLRCQYQYFDSCLECNAYAISAMKPQAIRRREVLSFSTALRVIRNVQCARTLPGALAICIDTDIQKEPLEHERRAEGFSQPR